MNDQYFVYATAATIVLVGLFALARGKFDPFAPVWLFLLGYLQVYVVQAITYREWALRVRGVELVTAANARAFWALLWFLLVYSCGLGGKLARALPKPPEHWSAGVVKTVAPLMFLWGLICSGLVIRAGGEDGMMTAEENLLWQFPFMMLGAGILLIVTGRQQTQPKPAMTAIGLAIATAYVLIWMFNGKRSHSLIAVLAMVCAFYVSRLKRPPLYVLAATGFAGVLVVSLALGWRSNPLYERSASGFVQYISEFQFSSMLVNLNMKDRHDIDPNVKAQETHETEEYGGFLLMMDTVPDKAGYDYGRSYMRLFSTYIPRFVWPEKPLYGRDEWVAAWIAGSELPRDTNFTGPAIGVLGALQLNGGAWGTVIMLTILALLLRTSYDHFRLYAHSPWVQVWWALSYYNAWLMTVNDDPFVWFYYIYGHTILPPLAFLWVYNRVAGRRAALAAQTQPTWHASPAPGATWSPA